MAPDIERREGERRQSFQAHEDMIDEIAKETSKHSAWFKVFGGSIALIATIAFMLVTSISTKIDAVLTSLNDSKIMLMKHETEIKALQTDLDGINKRHQYKDQNGIGVYRK